jgi:alpha-ketoglutarate-dependent 2,4-dichlorophenoxyacetate dioxygenase
MNIEITPLHPVFAAEIRGLDFGAPAEHMPIAEIKAAIDRYGVLIFRNDRLPTDEEHVAFSRMFGPIELGQTFKIQGEVRRRVPNPLLVDAGNMDADGNILKPDARRMMFRRGDRLWHADMTFMPNRATYSLLLGHEIPPAGGNTEFCDMRYAYDRLPADLRAMLDGLTAAHSIWYSRSLAGFPEPTREELESRPPAFHKMVHAHPATGRKSLYLAAHASHVVDWPEQLGRGLIETLMTFATQPDAVYSHRWRTGDLVMWDNLSTMHRATEFEDTKYRRDVRRTTCRERPVEAEEPVYA